MRRLSVFLLASLVATSGFAIRTSERRLRIAILEPSTQVAGSSRHIIGLIREKVERQLSEQGFDAFRTRDRYEDVRRDVPSGADYYLEIAGSEAGSRTAGGVGFPIAPGVGADLGVVVSQVAARVILYDAQSFAVVRTLDLSRHNTTVMPTAVSVGRGAVWAYLAIPLIERSRVRAAAEEVAQEAADDIRGILIR